MSAVDLVDWLLEGDPAIRWQVLRDLTDASPDEVAAERARVEHEGWGARLLALEGADGLWEGGACFPAAYAGGEPGQPWTATMHTLQTLQIFGLDPACEAARRAILLVAEHGRWEHAGQRYFDGEVEPCINGRTIETGAYFGVDVAAIVERILGERLADGGWNCEAENGSVRSSFDTTIDVLDGLLAFERATGGSAAVREARRSGEEYLLERGLFRRKSTGEVANPAYLDFAFPYYWRYDVLRALDYFRRAGADPDPRMAEAVEVVRSKRQPDGRWRLDRIHPGRVHFDLEGGVGAPSRWNTLRALRVLDWWDRGARAANLRRGGQLSTPPARDAALVNKTVPEERCNGRRAALARLGSIGNGARESFASRERRRDERRTHHQVHAPARLPRRGSFPRRVGPQGDDHRRGRDARADGDPRGVRGPPAVEGRPDRRLPAHDHPDRRPDRDAEGAGRGGPMGLLQHLLDAGPRGGGHRRRRDPGVRPEGRVARGVLGLHPPDLRVR